MSTFFQIAGPFLGMGGGVFLAAASIALMRLARGERLVPVPRAVRVPHSVAPETVTTAGGLYAGFHDGPTLVDTPLGRIPVGFRYCPAELQTVAAFLHSDGSATCADVDCGARIPTTTEGDL